MTPSPAVEQKEVARQTRGLILRSAGSRAAAPRRILSQEAKLGSDPCLLFLFYG